MKKQRGLYKHRSASVLYLVLFLLSLLCVMPLMIVISASLSSESALVDEGFSLWPQGFSITAYTVIFKNPGPIVSSYGITILVTAAGTLGSVLITSLLAYSLSRKEFFVRRSLSFFVFFTILFNGGLVPYYIVVANLYHLKDTLWALILPMMVSAWNVLIMRTFFSQLPDAVIESAKIEGAGEYRIFWSIVIPLSTPLLAVIGLMNVLTYWNDWYSALLFIDNRNLLPLQYLLYNIMMNAQVVNNLNMGGMVNRADLPSETLKMAVVVVAIGPITFVYLYFQKFFVRGITIGSIKG